MGGIGMIGRAGERSHSARPGHLRAANLLWSYRTIENQSLRGRAAQGLLRAGFGRLLVEELRDGVDRPVPARLLSVEDFDSIFGRGG